MNSLSFENRVSLTHKSEELKKTVAELSSCYAKREEFAMKNSCLSSAMHTSEVCIVAGLFCVAAVAIIALTAVGAVNVYALATVAEAYLVVDSQFEVIGYIDQKPMGNFAIYNIV